MIRQAHVPSERRCPRMPSRAFQAMTTRPGRTDSSRGSNAASRAPKPSVPELISSAQEAAARYACDGQELGVFGDAGLVSEAYGRSGGMMRVSSPSRLAAPDWRGIVLCFPRESRLAEDLSCIRNLVDAGRHVVLFGPPDLRCASDSAVAGSHSFVTCHASPEGGLLPDRARGCAVPTYPAAAIVSLWAWLGEFVAALTRTGRMPPMYHSYDVPDARWREVRYRGVKFHAEPPVPMEAGYAAKTYLSELGATVGRFRAAERESVRRAAAIAVEARLSSHRLCAFAHNHALLRERIGGPHDPGYFTQLNDGWFRPRSALPVDRGDLVFCVGYSRIYAGSDFADFADAMRLRGARLIWSMATYSEDPVCGPAAVLGDEVMIDQHWGFGDAVVECPGYDVRMLPTSGVMAETVIWSVVSEMHARLHAG